MRQEDRVVFESAVASIRDEGRYRVFADIMRERGRFPHARLRGEDGGYRDIVVWCSNDYLGQGQSPDVLDAAHAALDRVGAGAGGTWSKSRLSLPPTIHNGVAINLTSAGAITSVKVDPATNMVGFKKNHVSFTANQIQVDWQKLAFDSNTVIKLDVKFANAAVGAPASKPIPIVTLANHQTQKVKLTDNPPRR